MSTKSMYKWCCHRRQFAGPLAMLGSVLAPPVRAAQVLHSQSLQQTTPVGFEPTRGDPIGLAGRRLNRSAKVSSAHCEGKA